MIKAFGAKDLLVTTTALSDSNRMAWSISGPDKVLDLPGDRTIAHTGTVIVDDATGQASASLHFDGHVHHGDSDYYVYGLTGGSGGVGDVFST